MKRRNKLLALLTALAIVAIASVTALADDNTSDQHWHVEGTFYYYQSNVPSGWHDDIDKAAEDWNDTGFVGLEYYSTAQNFLYHEIIPVGLRTGCPVASTLACTQTNYNVSSNHINWSDIYFNDDSWFDWTTSGWDCIWDTDFDVESVAIHEFGHLVGRLTDDTTDSDAAMYAYNGCQRSLDSHDEDSIETQYDGHVYP